MWICTQMLYYARFVDVYCVFVDLIKCVNVCLTTRWNEFLNTNYWWWWGHMRTIIMLESWFRLRLLLWNGGHYWATWDQQTHRSGFRSAPHWSIWPPLSGQIGNHLSFFFHVFVACGFHVFHVFVHSFLCFSMLLYVFCSCCFLRIPHRFINLWSKISASTHPNGPGEGKGLGVHWRTCSTRRCHQKRGQILVHGKLLTFIAICHILCILYLAYLFMFIIYPNPLVFKLKRWQFQTAI